MTHNEPDVEGPPHAALPKRSQSSPHPHLQLALLALGSAATAYNFAAFAPLQENIQRALTLTDNDMGLLNGATIALPMALASIPLGLAIDRGRRIHLLLGLCLLSLAGALITASATSFGQLFLGRSLAGFAAPMAAIVGLSLIGDLYDPDQRGRAIMISAIVQLAGRSAAFALGGIVLSQFAGPDAWRWSVAWLCAPVLVVAAMLLLGREPTRRERSASPPLPRAAFAELWRRRATIAPLIVGLIVVVLVDTAALVWVAPSFARRFVSDPATIGVVIGAALLVSGVAGPLVGGFIADASARIGGPRSTMVATSVLCALSAPSGLFALAPSIETASILLAAFLTIGGAVSVVCSTLFSIVVPNEMRGLAMSICNTLGLPISLGLAPLSISLLSDVLGGGQRLPVALAIVSATLSIGAGFLFFLGSRAYPAKLEQDESSVSDDPSARHA